MSSTCRRLTALILRWQLQPSSSAPHSFEALSPYAHSVRSVYSSALRTWSADLCSPHACQEQRRWKQKAVRVSKKAASKGMQSSLQDKRFQKQSMQHVKGKITIDSPEVIIGYHDPVVNDMPWTWMETPRWLWNRENRTKMITELVRSQQIKSMLKQTYNQDEDQILAHCRGVYLRVKDSYPRHTMPHKHLTKECEDAMLKEYVQLKREGITVVDFKPEAVPKSRMLQYRIFPVPKQRTIIFQVTMQLICDEVHTIKSSKGLQDIRLNYQPTWVLTKIADHDRPKADVDKASFGGWKLSARIVDHAIGKDEIGERMEVPGMVPKGQVKSQINSVWEQQMFVVQNDGITWQSWFVRLLLGLPKNIVA